MRRFLAVMVAAICVHGAVAHADAAPDLKRRKAGTRIAYAGLTSSLTGVALGSFAIGLGNSRPDAAKPFFVASGITLGAGAIGLVVGLYARATSGPAPFDAVSHDPIRSRHRAERRAGIAIGGLGAGSLATGIAHAVGAWRDNDLAKAQCPAGICTADGARLRARAHTLGLAADMLIGSGAVALAGGIILWRGGRDTAVVPVAGDRQAGVALLGAF